MERTSFLQFPLSPNWFGNNGNSIIKVTPVGVQSIFASGLNGPEALAFNSAGDLFAADDGGNTIYEFTPGGARSTFASGLSNPTALAFDNAGDLFVVNNGDGTIVEFESSVGESIFASGLSNPNGLAFQGETLPVPEPSALGLLAVGATALLVLRGRGATVTLRQC